MPDLVWPGALRTGRLHAAINGDRVHPAAPRTPAELAADARAAVEAGAATVHFHVYDDHGTQTVEADFCAEAVTAVRAACPGVPLSLSTSAAIEPDVARRYDQVARWSVLPDLISANQGEAGIADLCDLLLARGVGIEAGLLSLGDARQFVARDLASRCVRVLVEPMAPDPQEAIAEAAAMEEILTVSGVHLEQVHHGDGIASWAVNRRAVGLGFGIRAGLEDSGVLPDGRLASNNRELIAAAAELLAADPTI